MCWKVWDEPLCVMEKVTSVKIYKCVYYSKHCTGICWGECSHNDVVYRILVLMASTSDVMVWCFITAWCSNLEDHSMNRVCAAWRVWQRHYVVKDGSMWVYVTSDCIFCWCLQDLLKHTPQGHHDRMSLQLALTQLESLAEMLNERKREAEQFQAFKEMLRHISGKFAARPLSDGNRCLLREDNVVQLVSGVTFHVTVLMTRTWNWPRRLSTVTEATS